MEHDKFENLEIVAETLYTEYCKAVGGIAFNGDKLPTWDEFRSDGTKDKQSQAWIATAEASYKLMQELKEENQSLRRNIGAIRFDLNSEIDSLAAVTKRAVDECRIDELSRVPIYALVRHHLQIVRNRMPRYHPLES